MWEASDHIGHKLDRTSNGSGWKENFHGYKVIVPFINERDAITLDKFKTTQLAEYFTIDTSRAFVNGRANSNHIYKLFGDLAGYTATQVRLLLLKHMAKDPGFHI